MNTKKEKRSAIWEILFTYLAASKIIYWYGTIVAVHNLGGFWAVGQIVFSRLLVQDLLVILIILLTFNTEKIVLLKLPKCSKAVSKIIVHAIEYVLFLGIHVIYYFALFMIFGVNALDFISWYMSLFNLTSLYLVIIIVFGIKKYLKKRKNVIENAHILSTDEKLAMLKTLHDNDVLTQEEYDRKKEKI